MENHLLIKTLGYFDYHKSWELMHDFTNNRKNSSTDEIWLLQHNPVFTLGYNGDSNHLLKKSNIPIVKSDRGGNITYHGPGQLIGYLLIDLKRKKLKVHDLVRFTEKTIINMLLKYNIDAHIIDKAPGVYVNNTKICSLGFRIKNGCSYHGFALNVNMDLEPFSHINPCGLEGMKVTQMKDYVQNISISHVQNNFIVSLKQYFSYTDISTIKIVD